MRECSFAVHLRPSGHGNDQTFSDPCWKTSICNDKAHVSPNHKSFTHTDHVAIAAAFGQRRALDFILLLQLISAARTINLFEFSCFPTLFHIVKQCSSLTSGIPWRRVWNTAESAQCSRPAQASPHLPCSVFLQVCPKLVPGAYNGHTCNKPKTTLINGWRCWPSLCMW